MKQKSLFNWTVTFYDGNEIIGIRQLSCSQFTEGEVIALCEKHTKNTQFTYTIQ